MRASSNVCPYPRPLSRYPLYSSRCSPAHRVHPACRAPPLRTRPTWSWSPPPTSTVTPPTGTTSPDQSFPAGSSRVATIVDSLRGALSGAGGAGRRRRHDPGRSVRDLLRPGRAARSPPGHRSHEPDRLRRRDSREPRVRLGTAGDAARPSQARRFPTSAATSTPSPATRCCIPPYRRAPAQGVRVGITGFTTPGAMVWNRDQLRGKLRIDRIPKSAGPVLESLRRESDLVVALVHSGMGGAASYDTTGVGAENVAAALAALPQPPDLVVVGHSHREMRDSVIRRSSLRAAPAIRRPASRLPTSIWCGRRAAGESVRVRGRADIDRRSGARRAG